MSVISPCHLRHEVVRPSQASRVTRSARADVRTRESSIATPPAGNTTETNTAGYQLNPPYWLSRCAAAYFRFWLLADNLCESVLCTRATIFDLAPPLSTYVAVDSPDESARCGQGSMIGRAVAGGRPAAPLPRRGTDAGVNCGPSGSARRGWSARRPRCATCRPVRAPASV